MDNKKYNVTILQTSASEATTTQFAKLFKISAEKAQKILQKESFIIKKQTTKNTAEKFYQAITAAGVNCSINEIAEEESALPAIEEIPATTEGRPLIDITRPDITPLHSEHVGLSLVDKTAEKNAAEKEDIIDDVDPANFCPDCGTIRAGADSLCIHCGYDPEELKQNKLKSVLIKVVITFVVLAIGSVIAFPYYQQFSKRQQIESDLALAFNTRNIVTEFIHKTNFWPNQNIDAGLDKTINNQSLKSVTVGENAVITVVIRAQILEGNEQTLIFTPNVLKGRIVWNCLKGSLKTELRPDICRPRKLNE